MRGYPRCMSRCLGEPVIADRRLLVQELLLGEDDGDGAVMLRKPVLIEAGQRYWVSGSDLVVESSEGHQVAFPGDRETRCYGLATAHRFATRGMAGTQKPYGGVVWVGDQPGTRVTVMAEGADEAVAWLRAKFGDDITYTVHNEDDANRPR